MNATPAEALWTRLAGLQLVTGEMPAQTQAHAPWYVRIMLCAAGVIAAAFLLAFVGAGFMFVVESRLASAAVGALLVVAAFAIFRAAGHSDFASMFALSVSFAGQVLLIYSFSELFRGGTGSVAAATALVEIVLAAVMPSFIHRLVSSYAAAAAAAYALGSVGLAFVPPGLLACATAYLWLNETRFARMHATAAPIAYGVTLAYLQVEALPAYYALAYRSFGVMPATGGVLPLLAELLSAAALVATVAVLLRRAGWALGERRAVIALAGAAAVGAASLQAPGVAGGLMIALLGFANGSRVLLGLGVIGLLFYGAMYYYQLEVTLMTKSIALAATGLVLLAVRYAALRAILPEERPRA